MLKLLSYNICLSNELTSIIGWMNSLEKKVDLWCFQEFKQELIPTFISELKEKYGELDYQYATGFYLKDIHYGELTVFNPKILKLEESNAISLGRSRITALIRRYREDRTSIITTFSHLGKKFSVANTHLSAVALNRTRINQLAKLTNFLEPQQHPLMVLGDMNYSSLIKQKTLLSFMAKRGLQCATTKLITHRLGFVKQQLDYIFYRDVHFSSVEVLPVKYSDHMPIFATFTIK